MFSAVAAAVIPEVLYQQLARRHEVAALRALAPVIEFVEKLIPPLFLVGLAFGLIAAFTGSLNFLAPWLIASYVVLAIAGLVSAPWAKRVAEAAKGSTSDVASPQLELALADRRGAISSTVLMTA